MLFTQNNHIKYTIGDRLYGHRTNSSESFNVSVGTIDHDHYRTSNYKQELLRVADLIYQSLGKDFALLISGGTDSEIVLRNFLEINVKPTCYMIRLENDYNLHDIIEATELTNELGVDLKFIDFNVKDFLYSGEASEFGKELQCTQITYLMLYRTILKLGMPTVMGGELMLKRNIGTDPSSWHYCFRENEDASAMRFSLKYNIPLAYEYFSYTPEMMLYYLEDPDIQKLVSNKYNYKLTSVSSKNAILKKLVPEVRAKAKTHGFEKLLGFNYEAYRQLTSEQISRLEPSLDGIEYNEIIRQLRGTNANS